MRCDGKYEGHVSRNWQSDCDGRVTRELVRSALDQAIGMTLATGYFYQRWLHFLERNCALALEHGGSLPIHVRLGVSSIKGSWWSRSRFDFGDDGYAAVEESYEYDATLTSIAPEELQRIAVEAFTLIKLLITAEK